jgi:hypothetical protein
MRRGNTVSERPHVDGGIGGAEISSRSLCGRTMLPPDSRLHWMSHVANDQTDPRISMGDPTASVRRSRRRWPGRRCMRLCRVPGHGDAGVMRSHEVRGRAAVGAID